MNSQPTCPICGGVDYFKDSGFYYCKECRTQSQDIREEVFDNWDGTERHANSTLKKKRTAKIDEGKDWTSWEAYNWILKGMVDQIIELGAKPSLKVVILQLWATYLKNLELAFLSKKDPLLPKLGPGFSYKDARLVYGKNLKPSLKRKHKESLSSKTCTSNSSFSEMRKNYLKCKRALIKAEQKKSDVGETSSMDFTSRLEQSLQLSDSLSMSSGTTLDASMINRRLRFSRKAREIMKKKSPNFKSSGHKALSSLRTTSNSISRKLYIISRSKLISFLQLGLLINEDEQQLSDVIRWVREGHLSYYHLAHFFPDSVKISGKDRALFDKVQRIPDYSVIHNNTDMLASFVGVIYLPKPCVKKLSQRFVDELGLPNIIVDIVLNLHTMLPIFPFKGASDHFVSYEVRVMAMIIFALKLLLGLDDKTEHKISETARKLNCVIKHEQELFVWDLWVEWTERRKNILSQYHFPSNVLSQDDKSNVQQLVDSWQHASIDLEHKKKIEPSYSTKCFDMDVTEVLKKPFDLLTKADDMYNQKLSFPATLTPMSTYIRIISSFLSEKEREYLQKGFKNSDLKFLLNPRPLVELCRVNNIKLLMMKRNSHGKFKKIKEISQTNRKFDNVTISIVPDEINETKKQYLNSNIETIDGTILNHKHLSKEKPISKQCTRKKLDKTRELGNSFDNDISEMNKSCNNAYYKQTEDFLYFHLYTVSNHLSNNGCRTFARKPTDMERLGVGLPSSLHYSRHKKSNEQNTDCLGSDLKKLKLYLPFKQYWSCNISNIISTEKFDEAFVRKLPTSFNWLVGVCADLIETETNTLLREVFDFEQSASEFHVVT